MTLAVPGLFLTVALPAYSSTALDATAAGVPRAPVGDPQHLDVPVDISSAAHARDSFTITTPPPPPPPPPRPSAILASPNRGYSGPTVRELLANPPYPNFSLDAVVQVALQYQGVPYRFGGADPSGFDCSGFTMFVYAQFGISLPHSAGRQGAGGVAIAPSAALPGDLVFMDGGGHNGIYLGNGMMIDSPKPGTTVQVRRIYSSAHWFVRYGI